jgi:hypothetical protein
MFITFQPRSPQSPQTNDDTPMNIEKSDDNSTNMSQTVTQILDDNAKLEHENAELQFQLKV